MDIDWFTFTAQIVNFLVLVLLLRWLLYGRIVDAMKKREEKIANRLKEADRKRTDAEEKAGRYEEKTRALEEEREKALEEARRDAQEERRRLVEEAREEVDRRRAEWKEAYRRERDDIVSEVRRQAGRMGLEAARRTLSQLADADLEERMCDAFATRLRELDDERREDIARQLGDGRGELSFRSAFDVPEERRERLREMVRETFGNDAEMTFETSADLICGLELHAGGYSFGWNVKEFLDDLELELGRRIDSVTDG